MIYHRFLNSAESFFHLFFNSAGCFCGSAEFRGMFRGIVSPSKQVLGDFNGLAAHHQKTLTGVSMQRLWERVELSGAEKELVGVGVGVG